MTAEEATALGFFLISLVFFVVVMSYLLRYSHESKEAKRQYKLSKLKFNPHK